MADVLSSEQRDHLLRAARETMARAYAPYSKFLVGAAILTELGETFTGCNVENASYGLTMCAERTAIFSAVAHSGADNVRIRGIAVTTAQEVACSPCGACRQVIYEFGPDAVVLFRAQEGWKESRIRDLLPEGFLLL
jgi:cytidine deaminase